MWLTTDELNFTQLIYPVDMATYAAAAATSNKIELKKYDSAVIALRTGALGWGNGGNIFYLYEYTPLATTGQAMPAVCYYRSSGSTATLADTLSARTSVTSTAGVTIYASTDDYMNFYIEIKSADLDAGYDKVAIYTGIVSTAGLMSVDAVMKPRYPQKTMATAMFVS